MKTFKALKESWLPAQGHKYHSKTNDELMALEKLHRPKEDHQSQVHADIARAILNHRATSRERHLKESEQLDEISQGLATKVYKARVGKMARALKKGDEATAEKHFNKSQQTADRMSNKPSFDVKKGIRDLSEESEQLDEISKSLSLAVGKKRLEQGKHFQNAVSKWGLNLKHSKMYAKKADEYFGKSKKAYEYAFNKGVTKGKELEESAWDTYRRQALTEASLNVKTLSAEEIAQKHGVSLDTIKDQIAKGIRVEHEHATSDQTAEEIARDHLGERPDYYEKLDKANLEEADLKAQWNDDYRKDAYARRKNLSRTIKQQLNPKTPGLGNKAWKRADKEERENRKSTVSASLHEETERESASHKDRMESTLDANKTTTLDKSKKKELKWRTLTNPMQTAPYSQSKERSIVQHFRRQTGLKESYQVGDHVVPKIGPHAGQVHRVIHVHDTGHVNITPSRPGKNRYHLGAAKADPKDLEDAPGHGSKQLEESATTSTSGMSFKEAIAHATKHGGKIVFGTNSQKWHSISPQDRDYNMPHASDPQDAQKVGEKQAKWGVRSVARSIVNRKSIQEVFQAAKDKKNPKDSKVKPGDFDKEKDLKSQGDQDPKQAEVQAKPPQFGSKDQENPQDAPEQKPKSNIPKPEKKGSKIIVKGPGADDQFQSDPIVTPVTTMPDTSSPKTGSQGVR